MSLKLPYIQPRGKGFRYRRAVPKELREALGKNELVFPLGKNEQEVARNYSKVHEKAEKLLEGILGTRDPESEFETYKLALKLLKERGIHAPADLEAEEVFVDPSTGHEVETTISPFETEADMLAEKYQGQRASQIPPHERILIKALYGSFPEPPEITLGDAKKSYLEAKEQEGRTTLRQLTNDANRIVGLAQDHFGKKTKLSEIRKTGAREFVKSLQATHGNTTVDRRLTTLKAIINHAIIEFDLNINNPFAKIAVLDTKTAARDKRLPFTENELKDLWERIQGHASDDLRRLWVILWGTGCRLEEVSGIGLDEIKLQHEVPHFDIVPNEIRGVLKGEASRRLVPLVGMALEATQEALESLPEDAKFLFPNYAKYRGANSASASLMKHVRKVTQDSRKVVYSLRHNAKDAMIKAGVNDHLQEMIFGRNSGGIGSYYGSDFERLKAMQSALNDAIIYKLLEA